MLQFWSSVTGNMSKFSSHLHISTFLGSLLRVCKTSACTECPFCYTWFSLNPLTKWAFLGNSYHQDQVKQNGHFVQALLLQTLTFDFLFQGLSGFCFAFLPFLNTVGGFIGLSYLLRFLEGLGTSMAWSSALGILMKIFPNKTAKIMSWTQTCFGLGYMLGND